MMYFSPPDVERPSGPWASPVLAVSHLALRLHGLPEPGLPLVQEPAPLSSCLFVIVFFQCLTPPQF